MVQNEIRMVHRTPYSTVHAWYYKVTCDIGLHKNVDVFDSAKNGEATFLNSIAYHLIFKLLKSTRNVCASYYLIKTSRCNVFKFNQCNTGQERVPLPKNYGDTPDDVEK